MMSALKSSDAGAQSVLTWLIDHLEPAEDGLRIKGGATSWGTVKFYEYLLAGYLTQHLAQPVSRAEAMMFVERSLQSLVTHDESAQTLDELVRHINSTFLSDYSESRFLITGFLPRNFKLAPETVQVDDVSLNRVDSIKWIAKYRKLPDVGGELEQATKGTHWNNDAAYWGTTCYQYERTVRSVRRLVGPLISELCQPLDSLRSVLNYVATEGFEPSRFSTQILVPRSPVLPSPVYFVEDRDKSTVQFLFNPLTLTAGNLPSHVQDDLWDNSVEMLNRLKRSSISNCLRQFVWALLDVHQKALDSVDEAVAFLHYWQVVERTASPVQTNRGLENAKIASRLSRLLNLKPAEIEMLRHLGELRNEFAHVGRYPYDSDRMPVHAIKPFADACVRRLLYEWADKLPTSLHLDAYLELATQSPAKLKVISAALKVVDEVTNPAT